MTIRKMVIADIPAIYAMAKDEPGFKVSNSDACFWSPAQLERWVKADEDVLLVAEVEGKVVGFALTTLHRPTGKATWENQYVLPEYRGGGRVAKALMGEVVTQLKVRGATYIHFLVNVQNPYRKFYEKTEFERGHDFTWFGKVL